MIKLQSMIKEIAPIEPEVPQMSGGDALVKFLESVSKMPTNDVPPIEIWQKLVESAGVALRIYKSRKK